VTGKTKSRPKNLQTPENAVLSETGSFGKTFMGRE